jgi:2-polyprenyl-6-methoxyphenol hydroxylase-like FAD-dependent oxidoreductase
MEPTDVPGAVVDVLVVGAGPTGLVLALWLARQGVRVRIVDQVAEPGTTSRAIGVQARTLELYRQLDLADAVVERGRKVAAVHLWSGGRQAARLPLAEMGRGVSPFPYLLIYPQDEHERLLIARLAALGVQVERPTKLVSFEDRGDGVRARLCDAAGNFSNCQASYLAGCDGARSTVRQSLGVDFSGGTYGHLFYVADVEASGPVVDGDIHVALDRSDFLAVFCLADAGRARLIGTVQGEAAARGEQLGWDDVSGQVLAELRIDVKRVNWFSTYHVHHRVASRFRAGRVFLLGDAAHIHSPVGAQGMNTGIGDAVNLAWKLAAVTAKGAGPALLDSYEPERIAFARRLVKTTDRAFQIVTSGGVVARQVRTRVAPHVIGALLERPMVRRLAFRTISQVGIKYRDSPLSDGAAGKVHGGDRLPWVPGPDAHDNFEPLTSCDWQVHVYGEANAALVAQARSSRVDLQVFPWQPSAEHAGLARDAAYLVRPDGHVAWADPHAGAAGLGRYLTDRALR